MASRLGVTAGILFGLTALLLTASAPPAWAGTAHSAALQLAASEPVPYEQVAAGQGAHADVPTDAGEFLQGLGERALEELTVGSIDEAERERRFRDLLRQGFDLGAIGRFVLGKHWRRASQEQQDAFVGVFEDMIVQRFLPMFASYSGQSFTIGRIRRDEINPSHVFVATTIELDGREPVTVEWRLRERVSTKTYKIIDVHAEGVSMAITLRQEYASVVRQSGLDYLIAELRRKISAGDFAPSSTDPQ